MPEQSEEEPKLPRGALPVLGGEAVEGQLLEVEPAAFLDDGSDAPDAGPVAEDPRESLGFGPSAVAVHDDGDVPGPLRKGQALGVGHGRGGLGGRGRSAHALALHPR